MTSGSSELGKTPFATRSRTSTYAQCEQLENGNAGVVWTGARPRGCVVFGKMGTHMSAVKQFSGSSARRSGPTRYAANRVHGLLGEGNSRACGELSVMWLGSANQWAECD